MMGKEVGWGASAFGKSVSGLPLRPDEGVLSFVSEGRNVDLTGCLFESPCDVVSSGVKEVASP